MARYQGCASGDAAASSSESATDVTNTSCDGETLRSRTAASFSDETSCSVTIAGTNLECTSLVQQASAVSSSRWLGDSAAGIRSHERPAACARGCQYHQVIAGDQGGSCCPQFVEVRRGPAGSNA